MKLLVVYVISLLCFSWILNAQQLTTIAWNDVVILGQPNPTSKTASLSANGLNGPPSLAVLGNLLLVSDYNNLRLLTYNLSNIATYSNALVAVNAQNLNTMGSYSPNGVEGYTQNGVSYIWVGAMGNKTANVADKFFRYTLPLTFNQNRDSVTLGGVSFSSPQAVEVDLQNQLLYAVDTGNNRVLQYSASDLSSPLRIYGQTSLTSVRANQGTTPSARTLFNPSKVVLGCNNDLYIVDARNNRILHYSNTNTVADAVLGQPDFRTTSTGSTASKFNTPYAASMNSVCTYLWVADTLNNRILKFNVQSLTSGMSAIAQLGSVSSTGPAIDRFRPYDIDLDERTGKIWIADFVNNRVLGGTTSDVSPPIVPTRSPSPSPSPCASSSAQLTTSGTINCQTTGQSNLTLIFCGGGGGPAYWGTGGGGESVLVIQKLPTTSTSLSIQYTIGSGGGYADFTAGAGGRTIVSYQFGSTNRTFTAFGGGPGIRGETTPNRGVGGGGGTGGADGNSGGDGQPGDGTTGGASGNSQPPGKGGDYTTGSGINGANGTVFYYSDVGLYVTRAGGGGGGAEFTENSNYYYGSGGSAGVLMRYSGDTGYGGGEGGMMTPGVAGGGGGGGSYGAGGQVEQAPGYGGGGSFGNSGGDGFFQYFLS